MAADLGPADVAELGDELAASRSPAAADRARRDRRALARRADGGLAGAELLEARAGALVVVDGGEGRVILAPSRRARREPPARPDGARARARAGGADRDLPAVTRDGRRVPVLANVAAPAEVRAGLAAGAEGVGPDPDRARLPRRAAAGREASSTCARSRPSSPGSRGRAATVRVLDFGGDKTPPFLRGDAARGIGCCSRTPSALGAQLRAIAQRGRRARTCASCCRWSRGPTT